MKTDPMNKLRKIRQSDSTWLCTVRRAPFWIFPKKQPPYRPFLILAVDQKIGLILNQKIPDEPPTPAAVLEFLFRTMQGTLLSLGRSCRPTSILIDTAEMAQALTPQLAELDIRCSYRNRLPEMRSVLLELEEKANKRKPIPGLLSIPGVGVPLVAELYAAAVDYYNIKPWRWMENWLPVEVRIPPEGRARYALVLGGGGEVFGISLYETLADVDLVFEPRGPDQTPSRPFTWLSVILDQETGMAIDDLDAIEQYGWSVAGRQAYPIVMKATSEDESGQLPSASEITWLVAALRTIPDFLTGHLHADVGQPQPHQATSLLTGVYGYQSIFLRFPAKDTPPSAAALSKTETVPEPVALPDPALENYIRDWYHDEPSHEFARQMAKFLFQFFEYLGSTGLSSASMHKHASNCWIIGYLECNRASHNESFTPEILLDGPAYLSEFKRKVSDSEYTFVSYLATWHKLKKYIASLEHKA